MWLFMSREPTKRRSLYLKMHLHLLLPSFNNKPGWKLDCGCTRMANMCETKMPSRTFENPINGCKCFYEGRANAREHSGHIGFALSATQQPLGKFGNPENQCQAIANSDATLNQPLKCSKRHPLSSPCGPGRNPNPFPGFAIYAPPEQSATRPSHLPTLRPTAPSPPAGPFEKSSWAWRVSNWQLSGGPKQATLDLPSTPKQKMHAHAQKNTRTTGSA